MTITQQPIIQEPAVGEVPVRGTGLLTITLWIGLVDVTAFGALIFFAPAFLVEELAGSAPFDYFALRWSGGLMLAFGLGYVFMLRNPRGQLSMFTVYATASTLAGAGFVWSWIEGYEGNTVALVAFLVGTLGLAALMWITRSVARNALS